METSTDHNYGKESCEKEFKSSFLIPAKDCKDDQRFVVFKAVCAMMNTEGGTVYIGIKDNGEIAQSPYEGVSGDIKRLNNKHIKNADQYARHIRNRLDDYFYDAKYVRGIVQVSEVEGVEGEAIQIRVGKADQVVYMHRYGNNERIAFRREGGASNEMDASMIKQREHLLRKERAIIKESLKEDDMRSIIQFAIDNKRKLVLYSYSSSNSDSLENRTVEPIMFICDGRGLWAYEERTDDATPLRQFKLCRIKSICPLDEAWEHEESHKEPHIDAFEWSRAEKPSIHISIILGPSAKNRLVEDCPEANKYLATCGEDQWILDTLVHDLEPVKRFCQEFKQSITVYVPDELKKELGLLAVEEDKETIEAPKTTEETAKVADIRLSDRFKMAFAILMPKLSIRFNVSPSANLIQVS